MFGEKFNQNMRNTAPELYRMEIRVAGHVLNLTDYDRINALLIHNNILDGSRERIAAYMPPDPLTEIYMLAMAGLGLYKKAALLNSKLSVADFALDTLVVYDGRLARYKGVRTDTEDGSPRFVLAHEDKFKTRSILRLDQFSAVSKYSGERTVPDKPGARTKLPVVQKALRSLLGLDGQELKLSDYQSALICPSSLFVIELLKETKINGVAFFTLFPSALCSSSGVQRIGSDNKKRSYVFYFVSNLSVADDFLRSALGQQIKLLIADGGKATRSASLIAAMGADQSGLEDIYLIDDIGKVERMAKAKSMGFDVWAWTRADFASLPAAPRVPAATADHPYASLINQHNDLTQKFKTELYSEEVVPYPTSFSEQQRAELHAGLLGLYKLSRDHRSSGFEEFLMSAQGLLNKLFQSPFPARQFEGTPFDTKKQLAKLKDKAIPMQLGLPPEGVVLLKKFIADLEMAEEVMGLSDIKYEKIKKVVQSIGIGNPCILVKRGQYIETLQKSLASNMLGGFYSIAADPARAGTNCSALVWTFKPNLVQYAESLFAAPNSTFIGYPDQVREMNAVKSEYTSVMGSYADPIRRARLLKIEPALLDVGPTPLPVMAAQPVIPDFEKILLSNLSFSQARTYEGADPSQTVKAVKTIFDGGFAAFFEKDRPVNVISPEGDEIVKKIPEDLVPGDRVVFLKEARDTIFDEFLEYYGHKPEIIELLKKSEYWRTALLKYRDEHKMSTLDIRNKLADGGFQRTWHSVESWLKGKVICPPEDNYRVVDVIALVTGNKELQENKAGVKSAAKTIHAMHIQVGRYLARSIVRSVTSQEGIGDPVLEQKLDRMSSYAEVVEVVEVGNEEMEIRADLANRLLGAEDL